MSDLDVLLRFPPERTAVSESSSEHVFENGHGKLRLGLLRNDSDSSSYLAARMIREQFAVEHHSTVGERRRAVESSDQSCLSRSVWAKQDQDLTGVQVKRDVGQNDPITVFDLDISYRKH